MRQLVSDALRYLTEMEQTTIRLSFFGEDDFSATDIALVQNMAGSEFDYVLHSALAKLSDHIELAEIFLES
jgi:hypothetical protein